MYTSKIDTLLESLRKLLRRGAYVNARKIIEKMHAADVAYLYRYLNEKEQLAVFKLIDDLDAAAEILSHIDAPTSAIILTKLERERAAEILKAMDPDDEVSILEQISEEARDDLLSFMSASDSERIEEVFQYPEDSAGRIMNTNFFALHEEIYISEAISELQKRGEDSTEMVFYIYVVDDRNHLVGICSLRQLLMVPASTRVSVSRWWLAALPLRGAA